MQPDSNQITKRIQVFYYALVFLVIVFVLRLFYLQVLQHGYYEEQASASQLKQYTIPAERGGIYAYDGEEIVPLVLNETRYRIVADPDLITDAAATAISLSEVLGRPASDIQTELESQTRYEILANKQTKDVRAAVDALKLPGIFTNETVPLRVYVEGAIAPQVLGFVNDAGAGNYGIEQALDDTLSGSDGRVKALTDQNNVPLLASGDNVLIDPVDGEDVVLSIDVSMQRQVEALLKKGLDHAQSDSGSIIVLEAQTGAVKSLATYPTYNPAQFIDVEDPDLYNNTAVTKPLEPGSIMKVLTAAAALDTGSVVRGQTYFDPGFFVVDQATINNVSGGAAQRSVSDILEFSLNTGATWLLMQMGGGELNEQGRLVWREYMVDHYQLGKPTGIEQGFGSEAAGIVPDPTEGFGLNIQYANTSFGQGMSATPIQMAAAVASVVNGGTYYQPSLVNGRLQDDELVSDSARIANNQVVSDATASTIRDYMVNVVHTNNPSAVRSGYRVGGKTGTAEIANLEAGGYYDDRFNGTYAGFVGGDTAEYVILVRVDEPKIPGYAGSQAAGPIFSDISNMLIDNFTVSRVGQ